MKDYVSIVSNPIAHLGINEHQGVDQDVSLCCIGLRLPPLTNRPYTYSASEFSLLSYGVVSDTLDSLNALRRDKQATQVPHCTSPDGRKQLHVFDMSMPSSCPI